MKILRFLGRGILHEELRRPCQDRAEYATFENGNTLLALSDGCSSAAYAELGAEGNIRALMRIFEQLPLAEMLKESDEELKKQIIALVQEEILAHSGPEAGNRLSDFSATLLFAVSDGTHSLIGHLGDGIAAAADPEGELTLFSGPENGESRRQTYFTVSAEAAEKLRLYRSEQGAMILLSSDGPQEMLLSTAGTLEQGVQELLLQLRSGQLADHAALSEYLCRRAECMAQRADDWSVLLLDPAGEAAEGYEPEPVSMLAQDQIKYAEQIAEMEALFQEEGSKDFTPLKEEPDIIGPKEE